MNPVFFISAPVPPGGGTPLQEANGDFQLDGVVNFRILGVIGIQNGKILG